MDSYKIKEVKFFKKKYYFVDEEGIIIYILKKENACGNIAKVPKNALASQYPTLLIHRDEDGLAKRVIFNHIRVFEQKQQ